LYEIAPSPRLVRRYLSDSSLAMLFKQNPLSL
jgi:hypothetical protein